MTVSFLEEDPIDPKRLSTGMPDGVKVALAEAIMAFAAMEASAERLIWRFTGMSDDDGHLLTRMDARPKFELCKSLSIRYGIDPHPNEQTTEDFWNLLTTLADARNKMIHGAWMMLDGQTPFAGSYRIPSKLGSWTGEAFTTERLAEIARGCDRTQSVFEAMAQTHLASPRKPAEPRPKQTPTPRKDRTKPRK